MSSARKLAASYEAARLEDIFHKKIALSKAVGRDGTKLPSFEEKLDAEIALIRQRVTDGTYKFTRYKEKLISKGSRSFPRVISIPTIRDRLTLRALCEFLAQVYPNVGVRKPHSYINRIRQYLSECDDNHVFVRVDIRDFYPSIDKKKLIRKLRKKIRAPRALSLIEKAINTPTTAKDSPDPGIPQGLSISNILAAVYLTDFDRVLEQKWKYVRYVDDILVISAKEDASRVFEEIRIRLKRLKLQCHELNKATGKSYIAPVREGVSYLGFHLTKDSISIRESSYRKMFSTLLSVLTSNKFRKNEYKLVWRLNLKITGCRYENKRYGWMQFFIQSEDLKQLSRLDYFVRSELKRRNLTHLIPSVKRFVKTYHELRYNTANTSYVPNFDNYSIEDMTREISLLRGENIAQIQAKPTQEIYRIFFSMIKREISDLEKDLMESFS